MIPGEQPEVLLDVTRMFARLHHSVPRGIDRVLLEYALHFEASPLETRYCVYFAGAFRFVPERVVRTVLAQLAERWLGIAAPLEPTRSQRMLSSALESRLARAATLAAITRGIGPSAGRAPVLYVNVAHRALEHLERLRRALAGREVRMAVMLHDLMPLTFPAYYPAALQARFERGLSAVLRAADVVLANSHHTASELEAWMESHCAEPPSVRVLPLGKRARTALKSPSDDRATPRFVYLGALEDRKNTALLFDVWRSLARSGEPVPLLELIGQPDAAMRRTAASLRPHVVIRTGLSDAGVSQVLTGARALLFPSHAEGYGLPVVEALAHGLPVVCSDIPALREVGCGVPELLPADAAPLWVDAVRDFARPDSVRRARQQTLLASWTAPRWNAHFRALEDMARADLGLELRPEHTPPVAARPSRPDVVPVLG